MGKLAMPSTDVGVFNNDDSCGSGSVEMLDLFQNLLKQYDEQQKHLEKKIDQQNQSMQEKINNLERKSTIEADKNRAMILKLIEENEHMQRKFYSLLRDREEKIGIIVEKDKEIADKEKRIKELEERMDEKERQSFWSDIVEAFKKQKRKMKGKRDREDTYLTTMD